MQEGECAIGREAGAEGVGDNQHGRTKIACPGEKELHIEVERIWEGPLLAS